MFLPGGSTMATIDVNGMTCAVCVSRVESAILELDGINSVAVNLARGSAVSVGMSMLRKLSEQLMNLDIQHQNR